MLLTFFKPTFPSLSCTHICHLLCETIAITPLNLSHSLTTSAECTYGSLTDSAPLNFRLIYPIAFQQPHLSLNRDLLLFLNLAPPPHFPTVQNGEVAHARAWEFSPTYPSPLAFTPLPMPEAFTSTCMSNLFTSCHEDATTPVSVTVTFSLNYCNSSS